MDFTINNDNLKSELDIEELLKNEDIEIFFQPILSVKKRSIVGVEGLCRYKQNISSRQVSPVELFELAKNKNLSLELDRLCRKKALEGFAKLYAGNNDMVLFLNFDISIINRGVVGSGHLLKSVEQTGISPKNIIIEITEHSIQNFFAVEQFISTYKKYGFLFALDDFGIGHSNMERIAVIKPNILKIDRSLITNIDKEYYKQEIVKSMINLIKKTGGLSLAEGLEKEDEIIKSLELGTDIMQGFYFSKAEPVGTLNFGYIENKIRLIADRYKSFIIGKNSAVGNKRKSYESIIEPIIDEIRKCTPDNFDKILLKLVEINPVIECLYILDKTGVQASSTIMNPLRIFQNRNSLFHPAQKGDDHSIKDYYLQNKNNNFSYITEPYTSLASGNLCVTVAQRIDDYSGDSYMLCVDIIGY